MFDADKDTDQTQGKLTAKELILKVTGVDISRCSLAEGIGARF